MAVTVTFYKFSKKVNSTAQPSNGNRVAEYSCLIKTGSGVVNPVLSIAADDNVSQWNYCYISNFKRYYFITEWTYDNGQWLASCAVDVLASWKTEIGGSTQYVTRCASFSNGDIIDTIYPTKSNVDVRSAAFGSGPLLGTFNGGMYVVGLINQDTSAQVGGVSYYAMTAAQFASLKQTLLSSIDYMGLSPGDVPMAKTEVNPFQYVVSAKYFPCSVATGSAVSSISLGWWTPVGISGYYLGGTPLTVGLNSVTLPTHPQASRGAFLNNEPFTKASIQWGPWGEIPLPGEVIRNHRTISTRVHPDYISGNGCLTVLAGDGNTDILIGNFIAPFGVDIALTQLSMEVSTTTPMLDKTEEITSAFSTVLPTLGIPTGIIGGVSKVVDLFDRATRTTGAGSAVDRSTDNFIGAGFGKNTFTSAITGGTGSIAPFAAQPYPRYNIAFSLLTDENLSRYGRPYCSNIQISTCSGFVKCASPDLSFPGTAYEIEMVQAHLTGGFFYE